MHIPYEQTHMEPITDIAAAYMFAKIDCVFLLFTHKTTIGVNLLVPIEQF